MWNASVCPSNQGNSIEYCVTYCIVIWFVAMYLTVFNAMIVVTPTSGLLSNT